MLAENFASPSAENRGMTKPIEVLSSLYSRDDQAWLQRTRVRTCVPARDPEHLTGSADFADTRHKSGGRNHDQQTLSREQKHLISPRRSDAGGAEFAKCRPAR